MAVDTGQPEVEGPALGWAPWVGAAALCLALAGGAWVALRPAAVEAPVVAASVPSPAPMPIEAEAAGEQAHEAPPVAPFEAGVSEQEAQLVHPPQDVPADGVEPPLGPGPPTPEPEPEPATALWPQEWTGPAWQRQWILEAAPAPAPAPAAPEPAAPHAPPLPPALVEALVARGDAMLALRDVAAARLLYGRAASAGDARAAEALARTHDPAFLAAMGAAGAQAARCRRATAAAALEPVEPGATRAGLLEACGQGGKAR